MVNIFFSVFALFSALAASADPVKIATTKYYIGESITTSDKGIERKPYIISRTEDPVNSKITEDVVSYQETGFHENSSELAVDGNSHFIMTESTGRMTGSGELTGAPWEWTFLRATFNFKTPDFEITIDDFNFFADPGAITAHKDFYLGPKVQKDKLFRQEDLVLHLSDKASFQAKRDELLKK